MAEPSIDVDKLVREVLAALGVSRASGAETAPAVATDEAPAASPPPSGAPAPAAPSPAARPPSPSAPSSSNGELVVFSQVVTMSELEGRLVGVRRLIVPPQAVVTPSVRDELHRKGIALEYDLPVPTSGAACVRLVMEVLGSRFDPAPLVRALGSEGTEIETHRTDCLVAATDRLAGEVARPSTLGLIVSTHPAIALCLANRHPGVRAVWGIDAGTVDAGAASVGANVLVVCPKITSFFAMKQMVGRYCRKGTRECPEALRERLG